MENHKKIKYLLVTYVFALLGLIVFFVGCQAEELEESPTLFYQYDNIQEDVYLEITATYVDGKSETFYIRDKELIDEFVVSIRKIDLELNKHPQLITSKNDEDSEYYDKYECYEINTRMYYEKSKEFCDRIYIYDSNVYLSDNDLVDYFQIDYNLSIFILDFCGKYGVNQ